MKRKLRGVMLALFSVAVMAAKADVLVLKTTAVDDKNLKTYVYATNDGRYKMRSYDGKNYSKWWYSQGSDRLVFDMGSAYVIIFDEHLTLTVHHRSEGYMCFYTLWSYGNEEYVHMWCTINWMNTDWYKEVMSA